MNAECIRHLFPIPPERNGNSFNEPYIDWYVWDKGRNAKRRLFSLTYDVDQRSFYAMLQRSDTEDSDFRHEVMLPRKITELLRSLLPPDEIARCTRASLAHS